MLHQRPLLTVTFSTPLSVFLFGCAKPLETSGGRAPTAGQEPSQ